MNDNPIIAFSLDDEGNLSYELHNYEDPEKVGELLANILFEDNIIKVIKSINATYEDQGVEDAGEKMNVGYNEIINDGIPFLRPSQIRFGEVRD